MRLYPALLALLLPGAAATAQPSWDWQLGGPYDLSRRVSIMNLDAENHSAAEIAALKARGSYAICYVSVGTREMWRPDHDAFPPQVLGRPLKNWPRERYLDIRRRDILLPIMAARFEKCRRMGFDAIEPDNIDVYNNASGFPLRATDTVAYVRDLARVARGMGLGMGQKNVPELTPQLVGVLDFVITEECFDQGWCDAVLPYALAGKPVLSAEYTDTGVDFGHACAWGHANGVSFILKDRDLTSWLRTCGSR